MSPTSAQERKAIRTLNVVDNYGSPTATSRTARSGRYVRAHAVSRHTAVRARDTGARASRRATRGGWSRAALTTGRDATNGREAAAEKSLAGLYAAIEATLAVAADPGSGRLAWAASRLREATREEAGRRPRHGAVALALADALLVAAAGVGAGEPAALREGAHLLLEPFITDEAERAFLDRLNASWQRVPPLEQGPLANAFGRN